MLFVLPNELGWLQNGRCCVVVDGMLWDEVRYGGGLAGLVSWISCLWWMVGKAKLAKVVGIAIIWDC